MPKKKTFDDILESQKNSRDARAKALEAFAKPKAKKPVIKRFAKTKKASKEPKQKAQRNIEPSNSTQPPSVLPQVAESMLPLWGDYENEGLEPSPSIIELADLYLHAAEKRSTHIALIWPASLKTLCFIHALACIARWKSGNKRGVRGAIFPVKSNVYYPLNHVYVDRAALLNLAQTLVEVGGENSKVIGSYPDKDAFWFSLNDINFKSTEEQQIHPSLSELLPTFFAGSGFKNWSSARDRLLGQCRGKLRKQNLRVALKTSQCEVIGDPSSAPDSTFALDGRMSSSEIKKALNELKDLGCPEVVLVVATQKVRMESRNWKGSLARFCLMLEEIFGEDSPGVLVVTDDPSAAFQLKDRLWEKNNDREESKRWTSRSEYQIHGVANVGVSTGIVPKKSANPIHPQPREFDVSIVDAEIAKLTTSLVKIKRNLGTGEADKEQMLALSDSASYLGRLAALPCGVKHLANYLSGTEVADRVKRMFDWSVYLGRLTDLEKNVDLGQFTGTLSKCKEEGSKLFDHYWEATPFAHKLANLISGAIRPSSKNKIGLVFTTALYKRLAKTFLTEYKEYKEDKEFEEFKEQIIFINSSILEEKLNEIQFSKLIFAGLNETALNLIMTDNRIPAHSSILLTQREANFLRSTLDPICHRFPSFRIFKPRIESILRQLNNLPGYASVLSAKVYTLPSFRPELSSELKTNDEKLDPNAWLIRFDDGNSQMRRDASLVYIYDPESDLATDQGFYCRQVKSLNVGDKLFNMSIEMRETVEQILREAGIPIHSDQEFEEALRDYHNTVQKLLSRNFPGKTMAQQVRDLRAAILSSYPDIEPDLPQVSAITSWINLGKSTDTPFEQLRPQAPANENVFREFASVLGFNSLEAAYLWQFVISPIRSRRRVDGRHLTDSYAYMLLNPEMVMSQAQVSRKTLNSLFESARDNVATINWIGPYMEAPQ